MLPEGSIPISDEEAEALRPKPNEKLVALLTLESENQITQRRLRETIMLMSEAFKQVTAGALDLSQIPGVAQVYAVESQAAALRAELGGSYNVPLNIPDAVDTTVNTIPAGDSV
jgi:hypothetical protein